MEGQPEGGLQGWLGWDARNCIKEGIYCRKLVNDFWKRVVYARTSCPVFRGGTFLLDTTWCCVIDDVLSTYDDFSSLRAVLQSHNLFSELHI